MTTFKMPGLSRYRFTENGECIVERTGYNRSTYDGKFYSLKDDRTITCSVSIKEIIQYGKHVKQSTPIKQHEMLGLGYDYITKRMFEKEYTGYVNGYNRELIRHKRAIEAQISI